MTVLHIACIGSRDLPEGPLDVCRKLGAHLVNCGHLLHSGNAPGVDQAFAQGGNSVDPTHVHLHLPWPTFERQAIVPGNVVRSPEDVDPLHWSWYVEYAKRMHPAWDRLKWAGQRLMARNGMIMLPCGCHPVDLCLAWPLEKRPGRLGGTGQGIRIAAHQRIRLIDLRHQTESDLYDLCEELTQKGKE